MSKPKTESIRLSLLDRIIIGQLTSDGNFDEQMKQLDFRDKCKVTQEYLTKVDATITVREKVDNVMVDKEIEATLQNVLQGALNFTREKDNFKLELSVEDKPIFVNWIHLSCRKTPNPPPLMVEMYRRIK